MIEMLLMRIVFRRNDVAIVAAIIVALPVTALPGNHLLLEVSSGLLIAALSVFMLLRLGLFCFIVEICVVNTLVRLPITLNPSDWYLGRSLIVLLCLAVLIGYGFRTSVAGPLFRPGLVED